MKIFCAILLLGVVTYVQADDHECARYAVKVEESTAFQEHADHKNGSLSLPDFLEKKISTFYTVFATPYTSSPNACTAPTHGSNCAGVEYTMKFVDGHDKYDKNLLFKAIQFDMVFAGYNKKHKYAIEYKMRISGADKHYFIFQRVPEIIIEAFKIENVNDPGNKIPIPHSIELPILDILSMEYALFKYKKEQYYIFVTCNLEHAWVTYDINNTRRPNYLQFQDNTRYVFRFDISQIDSELQEDINYLKRLAAENGITLELETIDMKYPVNLSNYLSRFFNPKDSAANQNVELPGSSSLKSIRRN